MNLRLLLLTPLLASAQMLNPADISKPLGDSWLTYSGDYSGRRYSSLKQIDQSNVKNLTLAWVSRIAAGAGAGGRGGNTIVGGEGSGQLAFGGGTTIKAGILEVDGVLYVSTPDNAWAVDARDEIGRAHV